VLKWKLRDYVLLSMHFIIVIY